MRSSRLSSRVPPLLLKSYNLTLQNSAHRLRAASVCALLTKTIEMVIYDVIDDTSRSRLDETSQGLHYTDTFLCLSGSPEQRHPGVSISNPSFLLDQTHHLHMQVHDPWLNVRADVRRPRAKIDNKHVTVPQRVH